ncbi:hypothetical protein [Tautonia plasticadhaerens]|uniref:Uncharacterized protein n=1 Tax=Tautonia plasticadhaerens TaxID=2527974 RepID=A0A518HBG9_9BACT|nr:hypothetical protein [Tautonia plasticadhaerens]QDV38171.1 hypothetical protein ElP_61210 [Tautonia plasticadhaerens]
MKTLISTISLVALLGALVIFPGCGGDEAVPPVDEAPVGGGMEGPPVDAAEIDDAAEAPIMEEESTELEIEPPAN